jgi:hypothetical protein
MVVSRVRKASAPRRIRWYSTGNKKGTLFRRNRILGRQKVSVAYFYLSHYYFQFIARKQIRAGQ